MDIPVGPNWADTESQRQGHAPKSTVFRTQFALNRFVEPAAFPLLRGSADKDVDEYFVNYFDFFNICYCHLA
jgi:hypothetical protein